MPIHVTHVIARLNVGGPAAIIAGLRRHLDDRDFRVTILAGNVPRHEADFRDLLDGDLTVVPIHRLGPCIRPVADTAALAEITGLLRDLRPDIVHTHTAKAGALGRVAGVIAQVPHVIHSFHGHLLRGYFSPLMTSAVVQAERLLATRTDRLVAVGERVRDDLLDARIGRPGQYAVIPPSITPPTEPPDGVARKTLDLPPDAPVVAFVGRLAGIKRVDRFAAVVLQLQQRYPDLHVLVAGGGSGLSLLERMLAPLGDRFRPLGWFADMGTVYAAADLLLLTSDNEGMPVTLIEAAHCGLPTVATDVGSVGEVVVHGRTGLVVRPEICDLVEAADKLLGDPTLRACMGAAARRQAQERFGVEPTVGRVAALYRAVTDH